MHRRCQGSDQEAADATCRAACVVEGLGLFLRISELQCVCAQEVVRVGSRSGKSSEKSNAMTCAAVVQERDR